MPEYVDSELITMIFDGVLVASVIGLWVLWWKQMRQKVKIEQALMEASTQLQEATLMLNQALIQIQDLQSDAALDQVSFKTTDAENEDASVQEEREQRVSRSSLDRDEQYESSANISQVAQMLRLQREGETPEKIAEKLNMPLAQIKLMLMLQSSPKVSR